MEPGIRYLPDLFTAAKARDVLSSATSHQPPATERDYLAAVKSLAIGLLGSAVATYGDSLKGEQEVLAQIADVIIEAYAIESGLARAEKLAKRNDGRASLAADAVQVYTGDASDRVARAARQVVAALTARGADGSLAAGVRRLTAYTGADVIAARRRIADAVIDAGKHPF